MYAGDVDGEPYENELARPSNCAGARSSESTLEDTQKLAGALERLHAAGEAEAVAQPIVAV